MEATGVRSHRRNADALSHHHSSYKKRETDNIAPRLQPDQALLERNREQYDKHSIYISKKAEIRSGIGDGIYR